uniref:GTD-binding domain-containing protein n=1 Tax=Nelumbo nucifera TaxID=4432 RepID=A0A822ZZM6_NELNU|nr:TPA_asm: hypothetical protein HUJ06_018213 [Nelumbo nucifera]
MDSKVISPSTDLLQCCKCSCRCTLIHSSWHHLVKRKSEEPEASSQNAPTDFSIFRIELENECMALREALSSQQQTIQDLYSELEAERNAAASAAKEVMSMILKLQREKAEAQMEARQFKRFAEEKMAHDQQKLLTLEDLFYKSEQATQFLIYLVQAYRHMMLSYGLSEAEIEGEKGRYPIHLNSRVENLETQFKFSSYGFGETLGARELQNLEDRICELERNLSCNQMDGEFNNKVVVGKSPKWLRHALKLSRETSSSSFGLVKGTGQDSSVEMMYPAYSFKKTQYFSQPDDYSNLRKIDNVPDLGDGMSDRLYTIDSVHPIDSIHHEASYNDDPEPRATIGACEDYCNTPRESFFNQANIGDPDIKKLYTRHQALEADIESMKQTINSMLMDKSQLILLGKIADQHMCKEIPPEGRMRVPVKRPSLIDSLPFMSVLKWVVSIFWRKKAHRSKYTFGLSRNNLSLLLLLCKVLYMRQWRHLSRA